MYLNNTSEATHPDIHSIWVASDALLKYSCLPQVLLKMEFVVFFLFTLLIIQEGEDRNC